MCVCACFFNNIRFKLVDISWSTCTCRWVSKNINFALYLKLIRVTGQSLLIEFPRNRSKRFSDSTIVSLANLMFRKGKVVLCNFMTLHLKFSFSLFQQRWQILLRKTNAWVND